MQAKNWDVLVGGEFACGPFSEQGATDQAARMRGAGITSARAYPTPADTATATGREILARAMGHANFAPREIHALATELGASRGAIFCMMDTANAVQTGTTDIHDGAVLIRWAQGRD